MRTINGIYTIKDDVAAIYTSRPVFYLFATHAEAERAFRSSFLRGDLAEVMENPGDFHVYCIGSIDIETGKITPTEPELIANFISYVKKEKEDE